MLKKRMLILLIIMLIVSFKLPGAKELFKTSFNDGYSLMATTVEKIIPIKLPKKITIIVDKKKDNINNNIDKNNDKPSSKPNNNNNNIDPPSGGEQNNVVTGEKDYSLIHRKEFSKIANRIAKNNLLTGVGFGTYIDYMKSTEFKQKYSDYKFSMTHPHSGIILMKAEIGIIATFFFFSFLASTLIINIFLGFSSRNSLTRDLLKINSFIIIGFVLVNIAAENSIYDTQIFPLFLIISGLILGFSISTFKSNDKKLKIFNK